MVVPSLVRFLILVWLALIGLHVHNEYSYNLVGGFSVLQKLSFNEVVKEMESIGVLVLNSWNLLSGIAPA